MIFFVLSRVTGLLREVIVAAQFGASAELDAYLAAFRVPDLLFQLVAGGALGCAAGHRARYVRRLTPHPFGFGLGGTDDDDHTRSGG